MFGGNFGMQPSRSCNSPEPVSVSARYFLFTHKSKYSRDRHAYSLLLKRLLIDVVLIPERTLDA